VEKSATAASWRPATAAAPHLGQAACSSQSAPQPAAASRSRGRAPCGNVFGNLFIVMGLSFEPESELRQTAGDAGASTAAPKRAGPGRLRARFGSLTGPNERCCSQIFSIYFLEKRVGLYRPLDLPAGICARLSKYGV